MDKLDASGLKVKILFGVYGNERDVWIGRSKLVLNHHFYNSEIFEIVRVFYLMTNSIAVVAEVNESTSIDSIYSTGIYPSNYDQLAGSCIEICRNQTLLEQTQLAAINSISKYPQKIFTEELLGL